MTKQELMETYTAEQLADKYLRLQERFNQYTEVIQDITNKLPEELKKGTEFHLEIDRLQSEVEKYRKAFEYAKKERDCQITEYQKKIEELTAENSELHCEIQAVNSFQEGYPTEPIKVADMLINASKKQTNCMNGKEYDKYIFEKWQLRQIAEHLLVYCNNQKENVDE